MLAWLHQATASEKEHLQSLLKKSSSNWFQIANVISAVLKLDSVEIQIYERINDILLAITAFFKGGEGQLWRNNEYYIKCPMYIIILLVPTPCIE